MRPARDRRPGRYRLAPGGRGAAGRSGCGRPGTGGPAATLRDVRDIEIRGDMIRLGQFLKLADIMESGGESKELILDGEVSVNGEVDTRRGRQLHKGDVVRVLGEALRVA